MKYFEYNFIETRFATESYFNRIGASGWELCCFDNNNEVFIFKREKE